jgi:hypothetical protein
MADDLSPYADHVAQLTNHVEAGKTYQGCKTPHNALVRTLCAQRGVTINGRDPALVCVSQPGHTK